MAQVGTSFRDTRQLVPAPLSWRLRNITLVSAPSTMIVFAGHLSQPVLTQVHSLSEFLKKTDRLTYTQSSGFSVGGFYII